MNWNHITFTRKRKEYFSSTYTLSGFRTKEELEEYRLYREEHDRGYSPSFSGISQEPDGLWSCQFTIYHSCD